MIVRTGFPSLTAMSHAIGDEITVLSGSSITTTASQWPARSGGVPVMRVSWTGVVEDGGSFGACWSSVVLT
jgi:hypothetical protein